MDVGWAEGGLRQEAVRRGSQVLTSGNGVMGVSLTCPEKYAKILEVRRMRIIMTHFVC